VVFEKAGRIGVRRRKAERGNRTKKRDSGIKRRKAKGGRRKKKEKEKDAGFEQPNV
jgi:hypothetical protein